jgi:pilus assembly protein CpaE
VAGESILVVDDDRTTRTLVSTSLQRLGYEVRTAGDGREALRAVADQTPDLLITDVRMPDLDGLELTQRLRRDPRTVRLPIIMLSDRKRSAEMLAGYEQGADDYVPKPVDIAVLTTKIRLLLRRAAPRELAGEAALVPSGTVVVVLHGKGGVGATSLAVNTAVALATADASRVALLDLNLEFGNAAVLLDVQPKSTLAELAGVAVADLDEDSFARCVAAHRSGVRVVVCSAGPESAELISPLVVQQTIARLRAREDYVLVDTPASFAEVVLAAIDSAQVIWLVTTPQVPALKTTVDCLRVLAAMDVPASRVQIVLNRTTPAGLATELIAKTLGRAPDLIIPYTAQFDEAANDGQPLVTRHPGSTGALEVASFATSLPSVVASVA